MAAIIPCDKCIHGKVCAMGFQFRRETANVTIVCKDFVRKTDVAPRAEAIDELKRYIRLNEDIALKCKRENGEQNEEYFKGKLAAFKQIRGFIDCELKKKYTERGGEK